MRVLKLVETSQLGFRSPLCETAGKVGRYRGFSRAFSPRLLPESLIELALAGREAFCSLSRGTLTRIYINIIHVKFPCDRVDLDTALRRIKSTCGSR